MNYIELKRNFALKYTKWFAFTSIMFVFVMILGFGFFGSVFSDKTVKLITPLMLILPLIIAVLALFSNALNRLPIILIFAAYIVMGIYCLTDISKIIISPFSFIGAYLYFRLYCICGINDLLKNEDGYPTFCDLSK